MREAALLAAGDAFSALADADEEAGGALRNMPALSIQPLLNNVLEQVITQLISCDFVFMLVTVMLLQLPALFIVSLNVLCCSRRIWQLMASRTGRLS